MVCIGRYYVVGYTYGVYSIKVICSWVIAGYAMVSIFWSIILAGLKIIEEIKDY